MSDDRPDIEPLRGRQKAPHASELESFWEMLHAGNPDDALDYADELLERFPQDGDSRLARAAAAYECGLPSEALTEADFAIEYGAEDQTLSLWHRSACLHALWRFAEARDTLDELIDSDPTFPLAWFLQAQVCEMLGDEIGARRGYDRAAQLAPEQFYRPMRLSDDEVDAAIQNARADLDDEFRAALDELAIVVEEYPDREIAQAHSSEGDPLPPDLFGLYIGTNLLEKSSFHPVEEPGIIFIYRKNLERICSSADEVIEEIRRTLYHELAHHIGFEEEHMADMDLD